MKNWLSRIRSGSLAPPLLAFLASRFVVSLGAWHEHLSIWSVNTWARWDSLHYGTIATKGYRIYPCPEHLWCGNVGWFPSYPFAMRALMFFGCSPGVAGLILSALFTFLTLFILWNGFLKREPQQNRETALALAAFFPGHIYYHALFAESMMTFCFILFLWLIKESKWIAAAGAAFMAACCHAVGIWLSLVFALWRFVYCPKVRQRLSQTALLLIAPIIGFLSVLAYQRMVIGWWGACFKIHEADQWSSGNVWQELGQILIVPSVFRATHWTEISILIQSFTVDIFVMLIVREVWRRRQKTLSDLQALVLIFVFIYWVGPHLSGIQISYYRKEALLVPLVLLADLLPLRTVRILLAIFFALSLPMAIQFFQYHLV
jgi:hypothetical protein